MSNWGSHEGHIGHICDVMRATTTILACGLVKGSTQPMGRMFAMPAIRHKAAPSLNNNQTHIQITFLITHHKTMTSADSTTLILEYQLSHTEGYQVIVSSN